MARRTTTTLSDTVEPVMTAAEILELQRIVREVPASDHVIRYALGRWCGRRASASRACPTSCRTRSVGARARAPCSFSSWAGRPAPCCKAAPTSPAKTSRPWPNPCLRHRLVLTFTAESEGVTADQIVDRILAITPTREDELTGDARFQKIFAS